MNTILLISAGLFGSFADQPQVHDAGSKQLKEIQRDLDSIKSKYAAAPRPATEEERKRTRARYFDEMQSCMRRALKLAQAHPRDSETFEVLDFITSGPPQFPETGMALDILRRYYAADKRMGLVCYRALGYRIFYGATEELLREVRARNPDRQVRGIATFALAFTLRDYAKLVDFARDPATVQGWQSEYPKELVAKIERANSDELLKEVEKLYQEIIDDHSEIKHPARAATLGELAMAALFDMKFLQPGKIPPDILGEDLEGAKLKLSDYRGKVVMIVFWASWCSPCMAEVPHERELVKRFKDRPFVLLGVNVDEQKESARKAVMKHDIAWRSFWDGKEGPITLAWNIDSYPTVYVLDAKGVIRHRQAPAAKLDEILAKLLSEAETSRR
jgi:thiol-disulfide isomerase/thioredoxin